jgi:TPP-dependent pyruvate/acetoin dehydrogenase alpha subunit
MIDDSSVPGVAAGVDEKDRATSVALLREMMRIRELEQRSLDLSTANPPEMIGSAHLCAGQEAVPVGALAGLANLHAPVRGVREAAHFVHYVSHRTLIKAVTGYHSSFGGGPKPSGKLKERLLRPLACNVPKRNVNQDEGPR